MNPFASPAARRQPIAKAVHALTHSAGAKWVPVNKSFVTLVTIILRAAAERMGLASLSVTLRCVSHQGYRHLVLVNNPADIPMASIGHVDEFIISSDTSLRCASDRLDVDTAFTLAMDYERQRLGYLLAQPSTATAPVSIEQLKQNLEGVIDELVRVIKRYQSRYRAIYIYGDQYYWIGHSQALRQTEQRIELLAKSSRPVVIRGDKGTGKVIAARALHSQAHADMTPFIESDCAEWQESAVQSILNSLCTYALGGSLLLRNIDRLTPTAFAALQHFWALRFKLNRVQEARLLMTLSSAEAAGPQGLRNWLEDIAHDLRLPRLQERREDVRDLARYFMRELGLAADMDFTHDAWSLLEMLHWRENVDQLYRLLQTLGLVCSEFPISLSQLEEYLPPQEAFSF